MNPMAELMDVPGLGSPDLRMLIGRLAALRPEQLRESASRTAQIARGLASACNAGRPAGGELARGWSASAPRERISRLLITAEQTASMLLGQSSAMDATCSIMERAASGAQLDIGLAVAEIGVARQNSSAFSFAGLVGAPVADAIHLQGIVRRLHDALNARIQAVDLAVAALQSALVGDPTAGPDDLRAGADALLPPDPVLNPAHRIDQRNRAALAADLRCGDPARMRFAISMLGSLQQAGDRSIAAQLLVYDPTAFGGQGRAAVSVGDLTTATNVAIVVPGIANSPSSMSGGLELAADLHDEAVRQDPAEGTAVIAWYGYDIPLSFTKDPTRTLAGDVRDTLAAGSAATASASAPQLAVDLATFKSMAQISSRITVLGFSMGSTTVSEAARYNLPVDSLVLMGSPGAGWDARTASGYRNVPASNVYVLSYDEDPVTLPVTDILASRTLGIPDPFGPDPASKSFGANDIDAGTNVPPIGGSGLLPTVLRAGGDPRHHSMRNYMQGRALAAEASVVVGRRDVVPIKPGR